MRTFLPVLPLVILLPAAGYASEGRTAALSWVREGGADECIATQALAQAVEERLGRKVFVSASDADVSVEGELSRDGSRWKAIVRVRDRGGKLLGTREVTTSKSACNTIDGPLAFVVSVMIDPEATPSSPAEQRKEDANPAREIVFIPASPQETPRDEVSAANIGRKESAVVKVGADASLAAVVGLLPSASLGGRVEVIVEPNHFLPLLFGGSYWAPSSAHADRGASATVGLAYASLGVCPIGWRSQWQALRFCASTHLGELQSHANGFDKNIDSSALFLAAGIGATYALRIAGPLYATASAEALVPLMQTELQYETAAGQAQALFQPSLVAATGTLGIGVRFPE